MSATINRWRARALQPQEREEFFDEVKSFSFLAETDAANRAVRRIGYIVGAAGMLIGVAGVVCAASLFPLKQTQVKFVVVDTSTGYVGEAIAATDAPSLFNDRIADHYLRLYIEARESYEPSSDQLMYDRTQVMSSEEERVRYANWHNKDPEAPRQFIGHDGNVEVFNFHPVQQAGTAKSKTKVYLVRFQRRETRGKTVGPIENWSATVQFQWHPEMTMNAQAVQENPAGFQVISYHHDKES